MSRQWDTTPEARWAGYAALHYTYHLGVGANPDEVVGVSVEADGAVVLVRVSVPRWRDRAVQDYRVHGYTPRRKGDHNYRYANGTRWAPDE